MVVDIHTHVGGIGIDSADSPIVSNSGQFDPGSLDVDYGLWTRILDQNGIDQAVIMPSFDYDRREGVESTRKLNDSLLRLSEEYDRFACPVGTVEPTHGSAALDELERIADAGFQAVSWHHAHSGVGIDSPSSIAILEAVNDLGLIPFIHCYPRYEFESLDRLARAAEHITQPTVILDALGAYENIPRIVELGQQYENLHFDTAVMFSIGRIVETIVEELGPDRLLFGSDLYTQPLLFEQSADLFRVRDADISDEARQNILEDNAKRLLDL